MITAGRFISIKSHWRRRWGWRHRDPKMKPFYPSLCRPYERTATVGRYPQWQSWCPREEPALQHTYAVVKAHNNGWNHNHIPRRDSTLLVCSTIHTNSLSSWRIDKMTAGWPVTLARRNFKDDLISDNTVGNSYRRAQYRSLLAPPSEVSPLVCTHHTFKFPMRCPARK